MMLYETAEDKIVRDGNRCADFDVHQAVAIHDGVPQLQMLSKITAVKDDGLRENRRKIHETVVPDRDSRPQLHTRVDAAVLADVDRSRDRGSGMQTHIARDPDAF